MLPLVKMLAPLREKTAILCEWSVCLWRWHW